MNQELCSKIAEIAHARRSPYVQRSVELAGKLAPSRTNPSRVLISGERLVQPS